MRKVLIFGNSASGKSTLAKQLADKEALAHLDLDVLAWMPSMPPVRMALSDSKQKMQEFTKINNDWVIEGCYTDLLELVAAEANEIIFMNLDEHACINNARKRPWEPHKYASKKHQDDNLEMLIEWIRQYFVRHDECSLKSHSKFFEQFDGKKQIITCNSRECRE